MRQLVVLVLLAVLAFCLVDARSHRSNRVFKVRKCLERQELNCKYVRRCVKAGEKCVQWSRRKHCAKVGKKRYSTRVTKNICLRVRGNKQSKCLSCARWGKRTVRVWKVKNVCVRPRWTKSCVKKQRFCKKVRAVKRCHTVEHAFQLSGPKTCKPGFVLKTQLRGKVIRRSCVAKARRSYTLRNCQSTLDPHTVGLNGRPFEFQVEGDFLMAETKDGVFSLHQRLKRFGGYTGTVGMAVRVNGRDVLEYLGNNRFLLNGKPITFKSGVQTQFPEGGYIVVHHHNANHRTINVFASNGATVTYVDYGNMANLYSGIPSDLGVKGYCTGDNVAYYMKNTASGLFQFRQKIRFLPTALPKKHFTKRQKKNATQRCKNAGLKGTLLQNCIKDGLILRNHPNKRRFFRKVVKHVKRQARRALKAKVRLTRRIARAKVIRSRRAQRRALRLAKRNAKRAARRNRRAARRAAWRRRRAAKRARRSARRAARRQRRAARKATWRRRRAARRQRRAARRAAGGRRRRGWLRRAARRVGRAVRRA